MSDLETENASLRALLAVLTAEISIKRDQLANVREQIASMQRLMCTPHIVKSTGMNGTTEERRQKRDTIEDIGPAPTFASRCVTDADIEKAFYEGSG